MFLYQFSLVTCGGPKQVLVQIKKKKTDDLFFFKTCIGVINSGVP